MNNNEYTDTEIDYMNEIIIKCFYAQYINKPQIDKIKSIIERYELYIVNIDNNHLFFELKGSAKKISELLNCSIKIYKNNINNLDYYKNTRDYIIPNELKFLKITYILGLDNLEAFYTNYKLLNVNNQDEPGILKNRAAALTQFTPIQVANLYKFPNNTGAGQTIAIIELGGGYNASDMDYYFNYLGLATKPNIISVSVDGAVNNPADTSGANYEVVLDIQIVGAIANASNIVVYFAPNTLQGFYNAFYRAIYDTTYNPKIISVSWGMAEPYWGTTNLNIYNSLFSVAVNKKICIYCAAGDNGSKDGTNANNVDYPAASPNVVACGGTRLNSDGITIFSEVVWNNNPISSATGGGYSRVFSKPAYQNTAIANNISRFRGVPDLAGNASPSTGYKIYFNNSFYVIGGTSAVSPLMSALHAKVNVAKGTNIGFINPKLYASTNLCIDIVSGNNGGYTAKAGWDPTTGKGRIDGSKAVNSL